MRILALDQGTTSTRLLVADSGLRVAGQLRHQTTHPAPGWVEQDAMEILGNCQNLLTKAAKADAIALANQGESCLAWDAKTKAPLSPIIVWQDCRTLADLAGMTANGLAAEVQARSGLPLDPYFSAAKLGWLLRENPAVAEAYRRGHLRLGTSDAFLLDQLAGTFSTDRATASRTGLMNLAKGEWDATLCQLFGVPIECLPEIRGNLAGFGQVGGTPVAAAITDQQAALYGHGCRVRGDAKITFGTGAFALAVTGTTPPDPAELHGLLPTVAWDLGHGVTYAVDGGVSDAGSAVEWALRAGIATTIEDFDNFPGPPAIERGLFFLPAFSGLGAPHWDRSAAPTLIGLTPEMTRRDIAQAHLEGIAFQTAALIGEIGKSVPLSRPILIDGGLSASRYFASLLAQLCQHQISVSPFAEQTAFGAASLAAMALGIALPPPEGEPTLLDPAPPVTAWHDRFADGLARARNWRT